MTKYTIKEKEGLLEYEIGMFRDTCNAFNNWTDLNKFNKNLLIESLALHTRVLIDFFYGTKKYSDDIIAEHLLPDNINWNNVKPKIPQILMDAKNKADKQLAHLSTKRLELQKQEKNGWRFNEISEEMNKIIEKFCESKK